MPGCGTDAPELTPVTGSVYLDGQPLPEAEVIFAPAEGLTATATTDASGQFSLSSVAGEGAQLGIYRVAILKYDTSKLPKESPYESDQPQPEVDIPTIVPLRYTDPGTSGLTAEVRGDGEPFRFDLTSAE